MVGVFALREQCLVKEFSYGQLYLIDQRSNNLLPCIMVVVGSSVYVLFFLKCCLRLLYR